MQEAIQQEFCNLTDAEFVRAARLLIGECSTTEEFKQRLCQEFHYPYEPIITSAIPASADAGLCGRQEIGFLGNLLRFKDGSIAVALLQGHHRVLPL
jgi:hypothetical protein